MRSCRCLLLLARLRALANATSTSTEDVIDSSLCTATVSPNHLLKNGVSTPFFTSLERSSRLVDITYCVGTSGIYPPFSCASRCKDFPSLHLVQTWNTGVLMTDSCGYIAVDHGAPATVQDGDKVYHEPAIIVAFRGTYSISNTIIDLGTIPQEYVPYPAPDNGSPELKCANCTVHMGFLASWRSARELVLPALRAARAQHPEYPVHLIGHSLGGAVAALAALEFRLSKGWKNVTVTTFGEPRVGNEGLVELVNAAFDLVADRPTSEISHYRRVTHADDPVPLLPLSQWGYRSHAGEIFITKAELKPAPADLRLCQGGRDPRCSAKTENSGWLALTLDLEKTQTEGQGLEDSLAGQARSKLWQLVFAHRDYIWRLGLCLPGGDPWDWGRQRYHPLTGSDDL